jgi:hypothetical protein
LAVEGEGHFIVLNIYQLTLLVSGRWGEERRCLSF